MTTQDRYSEAAEIVLKAMETDRLTHNGRSSICRICCDKAGWETCSADAARVKLPWSTTAIR